MMIRMHQNLFAAAAKLSPWDGLLRRARYASCCAWFVSSSPISPRHRAAGS